MRYLGRLGVLTICVLLASCSRSGDKAPTGQVAAIVFGQEITASDLQVEAGSSAGNGSAAATRKEALDRLINRRILVHEAIRRGLDKSPVASIAFARAKEKTLIELLQQNIATQSNRPTANEIDVYIRANPHIFDKRRVLLLEQYKVQKIPSTVLETIEPLNNIGKIVGVLNNNKISYDRSGGVLDPISLPPEAGEKLAALGVNDVLIGPLGGGIQLSRVVAVLDEPVTGQAARELATNLIARERANERVSQELASVIKSGRVLLKLNPSFMAAK